MKVLLDSCVAGMAAAAIRAAGHDVVWSGEWPNDPGDEEIVAVATAEGRVVITIDKDFAELAVVRGLLPHGMIRLVGFRASEQGRAVIRLMTTYEDELREGSILTAEPWRVRVRRTR